MEATTNVGDFTERRKLLMNNIWQPELHGTFPHSHQKSRWISDHYSFRLSLENRKA